MSDEPMEKYGVPPDAKKTAALEEEDRRSLDRKKCSICEKPIGDCEHTRSLKK